MKISLNCFNQLTTLVRRPAAFIAIPLLMLLSACLVRPANPATQSTPYFRPPAPKISATPTRSIFATSASAETPTAGPSLPCKDSLSFIKDLTIPDGTQVSPDSTLDKRWEVENNGDCNWGEGYRVRLIAGPELGSQKELALYPARSGSRAVIRIMFKAPSDPATYRSAWQAINPQGEPFGDPFFIEIKVVKP